MNLQARMRYREATVICRACVFSLMVMAYPAAAQEGSAQRTDAESAPPALEEIVVRGYQRSIESSVLARRNRTNFGDTIFAEDIGKFAEQNLAEAIQRISGVAIRRVNGEGLDVTLRGLGPSFTRVLLNGAPVSTASIGFRQARNENREFDFDIFPSELFTQIQVEKTQKASNVEGGIAGIINMRNHRPFDFDNGWAFGYSAEGVYRAFNGEVDPGGSALVSWVSPERKFGVVVAAAFQERSFDNEAFEGKNWIDQASGQIDFKGDADPASVNLADDPDGLRGPNLLELNPGMSAEDLQNARLPRLPRTGRNAGLRDRFGGIFAAQWAPTPALQFNLDTIFSDLAEERMRINQDAFIRGQRTETITPFNLEINEFDTVVSGTFTGVDRRNENRLVETDTEFYQIALSADWQVNDFIHQDFMVSYSESTFDRPIEISAISIINDSDMVFKIEEGGRGIPSIRTEIDQSTIPQAFFDFLDAQPDLTADDFFNPVDLNNPNDFVLDNIRSGPRFIMDENSNFRWNIRFGDEENNIRMGIAYDDFERVDLDGDFNVSVAEVLEAAGLDPDNPPPVEAFVADENSDSPERGTPLPDDFLQELNPPQGAVTSHIVVDFNKFDELLSTGDMSGLELIKSLTTLNPSGSGFATEETWSTYLEANATTEFMNRPLKLNTGVRVTATEVTTESFVPGVGNEFPFFNGPAPGEAGIPIVDESDYVEPLPSLNIAWLFRENMQFRFAIGRAITRPDIPSMIPITSVDVGEVRTGNADLEPFLSDQIDVGLEWYPFRGSILTMNFFWKDVQNFIEDGIRRGEFRESGVPISTLDPQDFEFLTPDTIVDFLQPINSAQNRTIKGVETAIVMPLDFVGLPGFLFSGNHTWVDSTELQTQEEVQVTTGIIGLSEHTVNITGSYESDLFSTRLSFNWRDGFIETGCCRAGQPELVRREEAGQLDLNASLNLCHPYLLDCDQDLALTIEAINLNDAYEHSTFGRDPLSLERIVRTGRFVTFGVRGSL